MVKLVELIELFGYMICLIVSKFHKYLNVNSMPDNEKTPSLSNEENINKNDRKK